VAFIGNGILPDILSAGQKPMLIKSNDQARCGCLYWRASFIAGLKQVIGLVIFVAKTFAAKKYDFDN